MKRLNSLCVAAYLLLTSNLYSSIIYVDAAVATSGDGTSWAKAKKTINDALMASSDGDAVWVAKGTYQEQLVISKNVFLYGGFVKTESSPEDRNLKINKSILDLSAFAKGVGVDLENLSNISIDGFKITGSVDRGGIYIYNCDSVRISNMDFISNTFYGVYADYSTCSIEKCFFQDNFQGLSAWVGSINVADCSFIANYHPFGFGGIVSVLTNCKFYQNTSPMYIADAQTSINNCEFVQNDNIEGADHYTSGGGAILFSVSVGSTSITKTKFICKYSLSRWSNIS